MQINLLVFLIYALAPISDAQNNGHFQVTQLFPKTQFAQPDDVRLVGDNLFVVESGNHRIILMDNEGKIIRQLGEIGNGPADLMTPEDAITLPDGGLYVLDHSPNPVKRFDAHGKYMGSFTFGKSLKARGDNLSLTIGVDSKERIYLNQPLKSNLISIYNLAGEKLGSFGEKISSKQVFPDHHKTSNIVRSAEYNETLNRATIEPDGKDGFFVSFNHAPVLRHYNKNGQLTFETRYEGPEVDRFIGDHLKGMGAWNNTSYNFNGLQMLVLANDLSFDTQTRRLYVLINGRALYAFSEKGVLLERSRTDYKDAVFTSLQIRNGQGWLTSWSRIFEFELTSSQ